jgi:hypothetical protein
VKSLAVIVVSACLQAAASPALANVTVATKVSPCADRHPMTDAWFTGPMLANTAATAPRGHYLYEPYLYDVSTQGSYTSTGARRATPRENSYGSLTYLIYGVTDRTGLGLIPTAGYNTITGQPSSSSPGMGDLSILLQRALTRFQPCRRVPAVSIAVEQSLPTGQFDRLGNRSANGFGAGAYTTMPAIYSQMYFWLPNRRIVRTRLDISDAFSRAVTVQGASVYGTSAGFRGTAHPGSSLYLDNSWEYSLTRSWVLALDATFRNTCNTRVVGSYPLNGSPVQSATTTVANSGRSDAWGLAPAVEYSWRPWIGVLVGVRTIPAGRNTGESVTPAVAVNIVH